MKLLSLFPFIILLLISSGCEKIYVFPSEDGNNPSEDITLTREKIERFKVYIDTRNPNIIESDTTIEEDMGLIILPRGYNEKRKAVKLIIYCHGGSGMVTDTYSESENSDFCRFLSSVGYAILDMNGIPKTMSDRLDIDPGRSSGSFAAVNSYKAGYELVIKEYNIDKEGCFLLVNSSGGLVGCNLVNLTNIPFIAQAGICPILSIERNAWTIKNRSLRENGFQIYQIRANIIRIYGMKNITTQEELNNAVYEKDKVGDFDPYDYIIYKTHQPYRTPFKILQSIDDPTVSFTIASDFMNISNSYGSNIVLHPFETGGHTSELNPEIIGKYQFQERSYELNKTVKEVEEWFNIFN